MNTGGPADPVDDKHNLGQLAWGLVILLVLLGIIMMTSTPPEIVEEPPAAEDAAPVEASPAEEPAEDDLLLMTPTTQPADPLKSRVSIESLSDPQTGWLRITAQATPGRNSSASAGYRRNNDFKIETANVTRFQIDVSELPVNRTRRFIMHIDGQDMLLFPESTDVLTFFRTPEGAWSYADE